MEHIKFVNPFVKEDLTCPCCKDILKRPMTIDCGHTFCLKCLNMNEDHAFTSPKCPYCGKDYYRKTPNLILNQIISNTLLYCSTYSILHDNTCKVIKRIKDMPKHIKHCQYRIYRCPHPVCGWIGKKKYFYEHNLHVHIHDEILQSGCNNISD